MQLFTGVFVFLATFYMANGMCNTCSLNGVACIGGNKFRICVGDVPEKKVLECPDGTECSPDGAICAPTGEAAASCEKCGQCEKDKVFACTDYDKFALCIGQNKGFSEAFIYKCPEGHFCSIDSADICVDESTSGGIGGTCPWKEAPPPTPAPTPAPTPEPTPEPTTALTPAPTPAPTTTPNPITSPISFCKNLGVPGRYDVSSDPTCKKYISCMYLSEKWSGNVYECPRENYFNATSQVCSCNLPDRCKPSTTLL